MNDIRIDVAVSGRDIADTTIIVPGDEAQSQATFDFNPGGDHSITVLKAVSAEFLQLMIDHGHGRTASLARTRLEEAKMWGVKSIVDKLDSNPGEED